MTSSNINIAACDRDDDSPDIRFAVGDVGLLRRPPAAQLFLLKVFVEFRMLMDVAILSSSGDGVPFILLLTKSEIPGSFFVPSKRTVVSVIHF